jgi:hypothetical protein
MTWRQAYTENYERAHRRYGKKHPRELKAVERNLSRYLNALEDGAFPHQVRFGFIHPEPGGVIAIDQSGGGQGKLGQTPKSRPFWFI